MLLALLAQQFSVEVRFQPVVSYFCTIFWGWLGFIAHSVGTFQNCCWFNYLSQSKGVLCVILEISDLFWRDLKALLCFALVLVAPNFVDPFKLEVDATALGAGTAFSDSCWVLQEQPEKLSRNTSQRIEEAGMISDETTAMCAWKGQMRVFWEAANDE